MRSCPDRAVAPRHLVSDARRYGELTYTAGGQCRRPGGHMRLGPQSNERSQLGNPQAGVWKSAPRIRGLSVPPHRTVTGRLGTARSQVGTTRADDRGAKVTPSPDAREGRPLGGGLRRRGDGRPRARTSARPARETPRLRAGNSHGIAVRVRRDPSTTSPRGPPPAVGLLQGTRGIPSSPTRTDAQSAASSAPCGLHARSSAPEHAPPLAGQRAEYADACRAGSAGERGGLPRGGRRATGSQSRGSPRTMLLAAGGPATQALRRRRAIDRCRPPVARARARDTRTGRARHSVRPRHGRRAPQPVAPDGERR